MPPKRSESTPVEDDDHDEEHHEDGKKTSSTQIRKAQNRIAQREFRLRKQQYIRDLEARVEILSGDKEERVELMLLLVRNLLKENKDLRSMVKSMATFIGEGMGSCLPRLGLSSAQLDAILNRADTDTAYEAFVALKASKELEKANPGIPLPGLKKRESTNTAAFGAPSNAPKRKRSTETPPYGGMSDGEFEKRFRASPQSMNASLPSASGSGSKLSDPPSTTGAGANAASTMMPALGQWDFLFPDPELASVAGPGPSTVWNANAQNRLMGQYTGQQTVATPLSSGQDGEAHTPEADRQRNLRNAVAHMTAGAMPNSPSMILTASNNMTTAQVEERKRLQEELRQSMEGDEAADRKTEALQLITYHLNNFRINHEYMLPPSLRPTPVQRTLPHEHAIDGILFPSIRDRMILLRGKYDLIEAFHGYITEFTLHGDDALDHRNWEASEKYLKDFAVLVDDEVYAVTNRWRAARGAPPLVRPPDPNLTGSGLGTGAGLVGEFLGINAGVQQPQSQATAQQAQAQAQR